VRRVCYRIVDDTIEQLCTIVCGSVTRGQRWPLHGAASPEGRPPETPRLANPGGRSSETPSLSTERT
ncbi:MAG: hypothetical protein ACM3ML_10205, partial [Micromonosporaceae bacterium]